MGGRGWAAIAAGAVAATGAGAGLLAWRHARRVDWRVVEVDDAVVVAAGALGVAAGAWFAAGLVASLLALARGTRPPRWAGTVARAAAVALAGGLLGTAAHAVPASGLEVPSPGWLPHSVEAGHEPDSPAASTPTPAPTPSAKPAPTTRIVAPGDTLWGIAADALGPGAAAAEIARAWPALYHANAATIGDDPNLILPGAVLTLPADLAEVRR